MFKKILSAVLSATIAFSTMLCFSGGVYAANAYELQLNVLAVNCYSGALASGSALTVQYSDATLSNNGSIKMYAQVRQLSTGAKSSVIEVRSLDYGSVEITAWDNGGTKQTASDKMGTAEFSFPSSLSVTSADDYIVSVWSESVSGAKSSVSENKINDEFEGDTSDWSGISSSEWMKYIDSSVPISQINLPGSHDSASVKFSSFQSINKTQDVYVNTQLGYGVRYIDLRVNTNAQTLSDTSLSTGTTDYKTCHSSYDAQKSDGSNYMMSEVIMSCYEFLDEHPTEFIYLHIQQDNNRDDAAFQNTLHQYIAKNPDKWYVKSALPTLGEVRGKLVYGRSFEDGGYGDYANGTRLFYSAESSDANQTYLTGTAMMHNGALNSAAHEVVYHAQDFYKVGRNNKWTVVKRQLDNYCDAKPANEIFINALNCAATLTSPATNAQTINGSFDKYTLQTGKRYGWLIFDFITEARAKKVYATNIKSKRGADDSGFKQTVLHYDFANVGKSNTVSDLSGNGFDGIIANSSLAQIDNGYITLNNSGKKALSGAGIDIPSYAFRGTNSAVTISAYIKPSASGNRTWFSVGNPESQDSNFGTENNWAAMITSWNGSGPRWAARSKGLAETNYNSGTALSQNNWQLLTYVMDKSTVKIYINSTLVGEYTGICASFDDVGSVAQISLGRATHWETDDDFVGSIADFKIYNYALNEKEILAAYNELQNPTGISLNQSSAAVKAGSIFSLLATVTPDYAQNKSVNWSSGNKSVATVSQTGTVTAVKAGTAVITAKTANGIAASCTVTVTEADATPPDNASSDNIGGSGNTSSSGGASGGTTIGSSSSSENDNTSDISSAGGGTAVIPGGTSSNNVSSAGIGSGGAVKNGTVIKYGKTVLYIGGKAVSGTVIVTVSGKTYAVVNGYVKTGKTQLVTIAGKTYIVDKSGAVKKSSFGNTLVNIGKNTYIINKKGVVQKASKTKYKILKVKGKKYIVSKSGNVQKDKKKLKIKKAVYRVNKKGVAQKIK